MKYEVLTAVLFRLKSHGILRSVDVRVVIDVSKDRTLISKVKETNVVNCLTLIVKALCSVENSRLSNDEQKTLRHLCRNPPVTLAVST